MRKIYEIYLDNIRNGIISPKEINSLENGIKQMERQIELLEKQQLLDCEDNCYYE